MRIAGTELGGLSGRALGRRHWPFAVGACLVLALAFGAVAVARLREEAPFLVVTLVLLVAGLCIAAPFVTAMWRDLRAHELAMVGAHDGLFDWNPVTKRLRVGARLLAILGYSDDFLKDTHAWLEIVHPDDREHYNRAVATHLKGLSDHFYCEYRVRASNGEYRWLAARGVAVRNRAGIATLMAGSVSDITERMMRERHIRELALNDQLTGLPNRRSLMERLPAAVAEAERKGKMGAILFIDLDRFKHVNDAYGHLGGDALLVALAQRLPAALRAYDTLLRQGGDELVVLLSGLSGPYEAECVARRLLEMIAEPVALEGGEIRITASIGVVVFPRDGADADTLLRGADIAMYAAKAAGGNEVCFFANDMKERVSARISLERRLRVAIENGDLALHFQPQKRFEDGSLAGAEALVRWRDGERMISPAEFIPLAEETGLIEPLGLWVMEAAVAQAARWAPRLPADFRVAINLSPRQFKRRAVDLDLLDALGRAKLAARRIEIEITESILLHPETRALQALKALREAGCRIALDDFGTGYSSLSYLQMLDLDCLKIDKSFVANLDMSPTARGARNGAAIVNAMVGLAHRLGYEVVAEGVEAADQYLWLKTIGCDLCQGYFFSPPVDVETFESRFLAAAAEGDARLRRDALADPR